uniref:HECT domain-containing protein n=1 Tax=Amphimedon queenslandica TaxID=400682 RepID=A0A1X7TAZ1_AMPQE
MSFLLGLSSDNSQSTSMTSHQEMQYFINEPPLNPDGNPLEWWRKNEERFPRLSKIARKLMCVPTTSVPAERVFSTSGMIVNKLRASLKPENVDMLDLYGYVFAKGEQDIFQSTSDKNFNSCLATADKECLDYMSSLNLCRGLHFIKRDSVYTDVMELYSKSTILSHYPLRFKYRGEVAVDTGGVARDVFSSFFEEMYLHFFEGSTLVTLSVHPGISSESLRVIGSIISHSYLVTGILPVRVAFPCLAAMLLECYNETSIPDNKLIDVLLNSLSSYDAEVRQEAKHQVENGNTLFSEKISSNLVSLFSFYGSRQIPSPSKLESILLQIAKCEFLLKPAAAIQMIRSGIPEMHRRFWGKISVSDIYAIYSAMCSSPEKILMSIESNSITETPLQERVLMYLRQYIGSASKNTVSLFLRYVTGSYVFTGKGITVTFSSLEGFARRPIAHTYDKDGGDLPEVSDETHRFLKVSCMWSMSNELRKRVWSTYKLTKVEATGTPKVDPIIKSLASQPAKTADRNFARIQTFILDSMAPLSLLLEQIAHERVSVGNMKQAALTAVELIGNDSAHVSHLSLLLLVKDDADFIEAAPNLFGSDFSK